jgi:hypothetical protein
MAGARREGTATLASDRSATPSRAGAGQVLPINPAYAVRGPRHVVKTGRTPVLSGITTYLQNGATIEHAQHDRAARSTGHESPRTTKLYDRTSDAISLDEIERILI